MQTNPLSLPCRLDTSTLPHSLVIWDKTPKDINKLARVYLFSLGRRLALCAADLRLLAALLLDLLQRGTHDRAVELGSLARAVGFHFFISFRLAFRRAGGTKNREACLASAAYGDDERAGQAESEGTRPLGETEDEMMRGCHGHNCSGIVHGSPPTTVALASVSRGLPGLWKPLLLLCGACMYLPSIISMPGVNMCGNSRPDQRAL